MGESVGFRTLLTRFRGGDPGVAEELCWRYGPVIRSAVRRHLDERLRTQFDSLDFVQDVWVSFLTTPPDRYTFETPQSLLAFLTRVARDKLIDAARRREARMGIGQRERTAADRDQIAEDELPSRAPAPDQRAIAGERWDRMLARTPPHFRPVVERLREGYNYDEIARMVGVSTRTIKRIVRQLKERADP